MSHSFTSMVEARFALTEPTSDELYEDALSLAIRIGTAPPKRELNACDTRRWMNAARSKVARSSYTTSMDKRFEVSDEVRSDQESA